MFVSVQVLQKTDTRTELDLRAVPRSAGKGGQQWQRGVSDPDVGLTPGKGERGGKMEGEEGPLSESLSQPLAYGSP